MSSRCGTCCNLSACGLAGYCSSASVDLHCRRVTVRLVQCYVRGSQARQKLTLLMCQQSACVVIQRAFRAYRRKLQAEAVASKCSLLDSHDMCVKTVSYVDFYYYPVNVRNITVHFGIYSSVFWGGRGRSGTMGG